LPVLVASFANWIAWVVHLARGGGPDLAV